MSLRLKSLLVFSVAVTALFAIVLGLAKALIERQFTDIEIERMRQQAERFLVDLNGELKPVASAVGDWAPWDELYSYVEGRNPGFPAANLDESVLANLRLDFFAIFDDDGRLVRFADRPAALQRSGLTPAAIEEAILREPLVPPVQAEHPVSGLILAGDQVVLVAALPITRSDDSGPPVGTLVGGRVFGEQAVREFEKFAGYRFRFIPDPVARDAPPAPGLRAGPDVRLEEPDTLVATVPIHDVSGRLIARAELTSHRPLHVQAGRTIRIFVIGLVSSGGILLFVVWYLLDANVIHPVRQLGAKLAAAAGRRELPADLGVTGRDELADLARGIEALARSVQQAEENYRAIVEDQTEFIFRYRPDGRITFVNGALCRYFSRARGELLGSDAGAFVAPEDAARIAEAIRRLSVDCPVVVLEHRVFVGGHEAWFRRTDRALFSADGTLEEYQCVARDFTQTLLTRQRLEASETRFRRLFETAVDGILIVRRADHGIADANPEVCRQLECERGAILDCVVETLPAFRRAKSLRTLARLLEGGQSTPRAEMVLPRGDGERLYLEVTAAFYEAGGEAVTQLNFRDISQRKRAHDELRQLSGHLLRLQDDERRRIARELHDSTAQYLTALQIAVTQLEPLVAGCGPKAGEALAEIRTLNDQSLREIRTISYLLHPPLLDEVGLLFALRWYVDGFMTRTERIVRLDMPETLERLPAEIETTVFRVVQEALSNIHRHSGSRRAWIRLALNHGWLELTVRDEGRGGAPVSNGDTPAAGRSVPGVGIAGMRERLRQFNGTLEIESGPGGTTLRATLPLDPDEPQDD